MALDPQIIIDAMTAIRNDPNADPASQIQNFATALQNFVLQLEITVNPASSGLIALNGPVTGQLNYTLS